MSSYFYNSKLDISELRVELNPVSTVPLVSVRLSEEGAYLAIHSAADAQMWIDAFTKARGLLVDAAQTPGEPS